MTVITSLALAGALLAPIPAQEPTAATSYARSDLARWYDTSSEGQWYCEHWYLNLAPSMPSAARSACQRGEWQVDDVARAAIAARGSMAVINGWVIYDPFRRTWSFHVAYGADD